MAKRCENELNTRTGTDGAQTGSSRRAALLRRFRRDEDGGIIIFSVFIFVLMLWFTGMSIDLMRFETTRTRLTNTQDRAVLAAADLDQSLPGCEVVEDYFAKAGMADFLDDCEVDEGLNFRVVSAEASVTIPLLFADLPKVFGSPFTPGIDSTWTVRGGSTAEERVSDVEVSLVLDVSSSMLSNQRFDNLVPAAHDFIDTIMANNTNAPEGLITLSIIPYSAVVNTGPAIADRIAMENYNTYSTCPLFNTSEYSTTTIDPNRTYERVSHFAYSENGSYTPITHSQNEPWCFVGTRNQIVVHSSDTWALRAAVSNLEPYGNTAIDLGMKWGVALLDPTAQPIVSHLASLGMIDPIAANRPSDWETADVLKVVVLMTDGENTIEYDLSDPYKEGLSTVWFDLRDDEYEITGGELELPLDLDDVSKSRISIQYQGTGSSSNWDDRFFWMNANHYDRWQDYPRGADRDDYRDGSIDVEIAQQNGHGILYEDNVYHASWQDLYAVWPRNKIYNYFFNEPYSRGAINYNTYVATYYALDDIVDDDLADDRLADICEAARDEGIIIYTVAFEAPWGGQEAMQDCASSPTHYFDVDGTDITDAFGAIASDIRQLKLTR